MNTYKISASVTISIYTEVTAYSEEEALRDAEDKSMMDIVHDDSSSPEDYWIAEELDGSPMDIKIEEKK